MKNISSKMKIYTILFIFGGALYCILEMLWSGHTHWCMSLCGGISLVFIYCTNAALRGAAIIKQAAICSVFITTCELICGFIVNILLGMALWDYAMFKYNFMGQICIRYSLYWFLISFFGIFICRIFKKYLEE